jgi:nucleotide-binding universal stress UspA family protein
MNPTLNPIGIALAFLFLSSMLAVFRWMFAASSQPVPPIRRAQPNGHRIIVPVLESMASMQAAELACQVAAERRAKIILVNVIEVPFTLGLDVPLPDAEEKAGRLLQQAENIARQHGLQVESCVLRQRKAEEAILQLARETGAEAIVLGTGTAARWPSSRIGDIVSSLFQHAPCEVVVARAPLPA